MKRRSLIYLSLATALLIAAGASHAALFGSREKSQPAQTAVRRTAPVEQAVVQKPLARRYAKLALGNGEAKPMFLVFEASEGTVSGYDTITAGSGSFANLEQPRKLQAKPAKSSGRVTCRFSSFKAEPAPAEKEDGKPTSSSVVFCTCRSGDAETFCIMSRVSVGKGSTDWLYASTARVVPSDDPDKAPLAKVNQPPKLTIQTKPDLNKKGNLGIALSLANDAQSVEITKSDGPLNATVVIKTPDGKVVKEDTQTIDKFAFG